MRFIVAVIDGGKVDSGFVVFLPQDIDGSWLDKVLGCNVRLEVGAKDGLLQPGHLRFGRLVRGVCAEEVLHVAKCLLFSGQQLFVRSLTTQSGACNGAFVSFPLAEHALHTYPCFRRAA